MLIHKRDILCCDYYFLPLFVIKQESRSLFYYHDGYVTSQSFTGNSAVVQVTNSTKSGGSGSFVKYKHCAHIIDSGAD